MISQWFSGIYLLITGEFRGILSFHWRSLRCPPLKESLAVGGIFFAALLFYLMIGFHLSQGRYYEYYNLAFDMDSQRIFSMLTGPVSDKFGFKHPFIVIARPMGQMFMLMGLGAKQAALSVMATVGAATVVLVWLFLRTVGNSRLISAVLTSMFSVSGTQIYTAIIPETYGFALFSIVLVWLLAARQLYSRPVAPLLRYGAALAAIGVTVTNVNQVFFAEITNILRSYRLNEALKRLIAFGIVLVTLCLILSVFIWSREIAEFIGDPVTALKQIWWQQTKGPATGIVPLLQTYLGYSFVSPEWSIVSLPEGTGMIDFRDWRFSSIGQIAMVLWLIFLCVGVLGSFINPGSRPLAIGLILALLFNLLFHLKYQYRGSLFLYAAHMHFLVFALGSGLGVWSGPWSRLKKAFIAAAFVVTAVIASNNYPIAQKFVKYFDDISKVTTCPAPCI